MPGLGQRYEIKIETISKPKAEYMTDDYFELDLPLAPAVMVGDEILVEGSDRSVNIHRPLRSRRKDRREKNDFFLPY